MDEAVGTRELVAEITGALQHVAHDRWQLNGLHGGRLWIIADSRRPLLSAGARCTRVTTLARRCLRERTVVTVTSIWPPERMRDWELDWPSLVYVPIVSKRRAHGVLIVGSRTIHAYEPDSAAYLADLGEVIAPWVRTFLELRRAA
jgi:hypothetical protein